MGWKAEIWPAKIANRRSTDVCACVHFTGMVICLAHLNPDRVCRHSICVWQDIVSIYFIHTNARHCYERNP